MGVFALKIPTVLMRILQQICFLEFDLYELRAHKIISPVHYWEFCVPLAGLKCGRSSDG